MGDAKILKGIVDFIDKPDWRPASGYEGVLSVSHKGDVKVNIAQLVAENFVPNPDAFPYVVHIDGNRTNNYYTNLRWSAVDEDRFSDAYDNWV